LRGWIIGFRSYGVDGDGDGRRPMSGPPYGTGGNGGGRPPSSSRIGFRTRSEVDVLDDGFKWRKYGKKTVKSSPNPRYKSEYNTPTLARRRRRSLRHFKFPHSMVTPRP
jgi:hypothetical protein